MNGVEKVEIGNAVLYRADCLDVMEGWPPNHVDAVITDPPYGIGFDYSVHDDDPKEWFQLMNRSVPACRRVARFVVMPCCSMARLAWWYENHTPEWLIAWYKGSPGHRSTIGFNDWEAHVVWGRPTIAMHDHFSTRCGFEENGHPCPKPLDYAVWLVSRSAIRDETVLDPFMGSGTTGVACARLGRRFIGIELDKKYFDIACRRIEQAYAQGDFFVEPPNPKQEKLVGL